MSKIRRIKAKVLSSSQEIQESSPTLKRQVYEFSHGGPRVAANNHNVKF